MAQSGQQQPDVPIVKANTGKFAVYQRMRFKKSLLHLPSICYLMVTENPKVFLESGLAPFDKCTLYIGATLAMTAFVIAVEPHVEKASHQVGVDLAAPTIDAIECSVDVDNLAGANNGSWAFVTGSLGAAVSILLKPYNVKVNSIDDPQLNSAYPIAVQPGMTVWQVIEELLRITQRIAYDGPDGSLILSKVGTQRAGNGLTEGVNAEVLTARLTGERYSRIVAFTQSVFQDASGAPFLSFKQESKDSGVPRNRLLMTMIDALGPDGKYPQQLADWMTARNYGRSRQVQITVSGFRDRNGDLWAVNKVVNILAPSLKVSEDMIIAEVEFILDDHLGSRTVLTCMPAAGLQPAPFLFRPPFALDPQTSSTAAAAERAVATGVTT